MNNSTYQPHRLLEYAELFTETHMRNNGNTSRREAACLGVQYPFALLPLQKDDLLAGRCPFEHRHIPLGFGPELGLLTYWYRGPQEEVRALAPERWKKLDNYWEEHYFPDACRARFSPETRRIIPYDFPVERWRHASYALYRIAGLNLDYSSLLSKGVPGLQAELRTKQETETDKKKSEFFTGAIAALDAVTTTIEVYKAQAEALGNSVSTAILGSLLTGPPVTIPEALQLIWIYSVISGVINYGRMDDYLAPFYDARNEDEAAVYITAFWDLTAEHANHFNGRVIVGGKGRKDAETSDKLARIMLRLCRDRENTLPQLSLRFSSDQDPELYRLGLDALAEGRTFPILYNDEVNIPAVAKSFRVPEEEARHYLPYGCGEYILNHRSIATPNGITNILKIVELAMNNGVSLLDGEQQGPATGSLEEFLNFNDFYQAFETQLQHQCRALCEVQEKVYETAGETAPFLLQSLLYSDCLKRGTPLLWGGARYLGGTLETYGNISASDSLSAIEHYVFSDPALREQNARTLLRALSVNFQGHEKLQRYLSTLPKYGNDQEAADAMAVRVHETVTTAIRQIGIESSLHHYLAVVINNNNNVIQGKACAASADGRLEGAAMSNGNNPSSGNDRSGVTAFLNSLVKLTPSTHAGAVQNMKFSREMMTTLRRKTELLLATYFKKGGTQCMITVLNQEDLENAMKHPEEYGHLVVRVGGYSDYFVRLPREIQEDVLHRTMQR